MATIFTNFLSGTLDADPGAAGTTISGSALASLPAVAAPNTMWIVLDPLGVDGAPEVVKVTAHTAAATTATVTRGQQSTTGRAHAIATPFLVGVTKADLDELPFRKLAARGSLLVSTDANVASELVTGAADTVLKTDGTDPAWGKIATANIEDNAITAAKIAADAVGTSEIAADAVTAAEIAAGAVGTTEIADDAVTAAKIATDAVTADAIAAGAVGTAEVADDAITAAKIAANAVGSSEIAADAVGSDEIAAGAVGTAEIADDAVTAAKIAAGAVGTSEIANAAVTTTKVLGVVLSPDGTNWLTTVSDLAPTGTPAANEIYFEY